MNQRGNLGDLALDLWGDPAEEIQILQADLVATDPGDSRRRACLLYELGRFQLATGDHQSAAKTLLEAYSEQAGFRPVLRTARRLYQDRQDYGLVDKLLDAEAAACRNGAAGAALLRQRAHVAWGRLEAADRALGYLAQAHELAPLDPATGMLQVVICVAEQRQALALEALRHQAEVSTAPLVKAAQLAGLAWLCAGNDAEAALKALRQADRACPEQLLVLGLLEQLLERREQHAEVAMVQVRQAEAAATAPAQRARLLARAARTALEALDNGEQAVALLQRSLEAHPMFGVAAECYRLLRRQERLAEAVEVGQVLHQLYPPQEPGGPLLARQLGDLCARLGQDAEAISWYGRCLELEPAHQPALEGMGQLLEQAGELDRMLELHRAELTSITDGPSRARRLWRVGDLLRRARRPEQAAEAHRQALSACPDYPPSTAALAQLLEQLGSWDELLQGHQQQLAAAPDAEHAMALLELMGELLLRQQQQPQRALECFIGILDRNPDHLPALRAAARICAQTGSWQQLVELGEQQLALAESMPRRVELLCGMGQVLERELDQAPGAVEVYQRVLELEPTNLAAALALARLYRGQQRWSELAALLESTALGGGAGQDTSSALLVQRALTLTEQLHDPATAAAAWRQVLDRDPELGAAAHALAALHARQGQWEEADAARSLASPGARSGGDPPTGRTKTLASRPPADTEAGAGDTEVGAGDTEVGAGQQLLDRAEATIEGEHALRRRENMLRDTGLRQELAQPLRDRIQQTRDALELATLHAQLAEVHLLNDDNAAAEAAYLEALSFHSGHPTALWGLTRLLEQQGRWSELAELTEQEAHTMESAAGQLDARFRAALIWEQRVEDPARASRLYHEVLGQAPDHQGAHDQLVAMLTARQDFGALASLLRARISHCSDPGASAQLFYELGQIYLSKLSQPSKGMACLSRALDLDPDNLEVLSLAGDIHFDRLEFSEAEEMYNRCLMLSHASGEQAQLYRRLGEIHLGQQLPRAALDAFTRAASATSHPDQELLRRLAEAARAAGDTDALVRALELLVQRADAPGERAALHRELSQVAVEELQDHKLALRSLEQALRLDPLDIEAIERVAAIHGSKGDRVAVQAHLAEAAARHREALVLDPLKPELYRQIGRILKWQRRIDDYYCCCVALQYLESRGKGVLLSDAERRFMQQHHYRCAPIPTGPLTAARFERQLLGSLATHPLRQVLHAARSGLQRRITNSPEALGLDRESQVPPSHPLRSLCDEVGALQGRPEFDLHVSDARPDLIAAEMLSRPVLILGAKVVKSLVTAAERFRIGRALFLIAENALVLHDMSMRRTRVLLCALGQVAWPPRPLSIPATDARAIKDEATKLEGLLDDEERRGLGQALERVEGQLETADLVAFKRDLRLAANRAGLVAGGDPGRCLEQAAVVTEEEGGGTEMSDLLRFMVSEEYFALRAALKLAPE